jgi:mannose-1-phosphate guanylyltransferase/phosphomannomutase
VLFRSFPYKEVIKNIYIGKNVKFIKENFPEGPVVIGDNVELEESARILPFTVIGENCSVASGTTISGSIIFSGCKIGKNCMLKKSILSKHVEISENVRIEDNAVIGDNTVIGENNILKNGIKINIDSKIGAGEISF